MKRLAKVEGPLFSIDSSGKIAKTQVNMRRKGRHDVRKYVIPKNPQTGAQKEQRDYMKEGVLAWKTDGYTILDIEAWNTYATLKKGNLSGYNMFLSEKINVKKSSLDWSKLYNCVISNVTGNGFKVEINVSSDLSGILYIGTSKVSMTKEFIGVFSVNKYTFTVNGLSALTNYYFYIKNTSYNEYGRSGIYKKKTGTAVAPVIIYIGNEAIDRPSGINFGSTYVDKITPANDTGIIESVEIFCQTAMTGCKVGIFYRPDPIGFPNKLSTRSYIDIGIVNIGYNIFQVNLNVNTGDFIGIYFGVGRIDVTLEGVGIWWTPGNQIPCTNYSFTVTANRKMSLKGTGTTL